MLSGDPRLPQFSVEETGLEYVSSDFWRRFQERFYTLWRELGRNDAEIRVLCDLSKPSPIGSTTPNTGAFTTLSATGDVSFDGGNVVFNDSGANKDFRVEGDTNANLLVCDASADKVFIAGNTDQGAYNLQVAGTGVWGAGAYVNGSDARIKEDVEPLASGLDVVAKLNPVTFRYKPEWLRDQSVQTGFIAQELLTALEGKGYAAGVVQQGGEYLSVAYQALIPILAKAIQEQQQQIDALKAEIVALK